MRFVPWIVRLVALTPVALPAVAGEGRLAGPVMAEVKRVLVRRRGIDAPDNRARCEEERRLAARAKAYLAAAVSGGAVTLSAVEGGRHHGRVLADVTTAEGRDVSGALLRIGRRYGWAKRGPWRVEGR